MELENLKKEIDSLNVNDIEALIKYLNDLKISNIYIDILLDAIETKYSEGIVCPYCGCIHIIKYGKNKIGMQMYKCKECSSRFNLLKNTFLENSHLHLKTWIKYMIYMNQDENLRDCASYAEVSLKTSFMMRHRILNALTHHMNNTELKGIVEIDNTMTTISFSGNHKKHDKTVILPRKAYKRGRHGLKNKQHTSFNDQIIIATAVDREGTVYAKVAKIGSTYLSIDECLKAYESHMKEATCICSDGEQSFRTLAKSVNAEHHAYTIKSKEKRGIYHINHVNYFHSVFKQYLSSHKGISSKYLDEYLSYIAYTVMHKLRNVNTIFKDVFGYKCTFRCKNYTKTGFIV